MFNLALDEKELQKIETLFKKTPERAEKILNSALRKAINYIAKENKEHIKSELIEFYNGKVTLADKGLREVEVPVDLA